MIHRIVNRQQRSRSAVLRTSLKLNRWSRTMPRFERQKRRRNATPCGRPCGACSASATSGCRGPRSTTKSRDSPSLQQPSGGEKLDRTPRHVAQAGWVDDQEARGANGPFGIGGTLQDLAWRTA